MSRRRGEFEHRTSIFEGAYRAWSHLGGVDPMILSTAAAADLDPLSHPHEVDCRINKDKDSKDKDGVSKSKSAAKSAAKSATKSASKSTTKSTSNNNNNNNQAAPHPHPHTYTVTDSTGKKRCYPYEPLPRSGLAHPFVQAIISPWLGPEAEHDDIVLGLTTLRTWWQHRRKGESSSAKSALGTEKMRSVVEGYTRHFFNLAHCIVMNDGEQPPRSLANRVKECERDNTGFKLELGTKKNNNKEVNGNGGGVVDARGTSLNAIAAIGATGTTGTTGGAGTASITGSMNGSTTASATASASATAYNHPHHNNTNTNSDRNHNYRSAMNHDPYGSTPSPNALNGNTNGNGNGHGNTNPIDVDMDDTDRGTCCSGAGGGPGIGIGSVNMNEIRSTSSPTPTNGNGNGKVYGDPNKTPVVFVSESGDIQIAMVS